MKGIDISHWQDGLDLSKVSGIEFVIIKATDGTSMVDPKCDHFYQQAKKLGLHRGVYHFYEGGDGTKEADFFLHNIGGYVGDAILALDFETHTTDVADAKKFLDRVYAKTGVKPVIYMSASVKNANNWSSVAKADYGLWLARWGSEAGSPSPWKNMALWQYTDNLNKAGFRLDGDEFYGDGDTWNAYAGKHDDDVKPEPHPEPDTKPVPDVEVDGVWGSATIKQRQTILFNMGLYDGAIDGTFDHQNPYWKDKNPGLGSGWGWDSNYKGKGGSSTIKADQKRLAKRGLYDGEIDGLAGEQYFRALQKDQQTTVDGVISRPSKVVKAIQTDGNKGKIA